MLLIRSDGQGPLYAQIYRALRGRILQGELVPGERLPPTRTLAEDLGASRNVVVLAYEQLASEGYVESRVGSGTFVSAALPDLAVGTAPASGVPAKLPPRSVRLSRFGAFAARLDVERRAASESPDGAPRGPEVGGDVPLRYDFRYGRIKPEPRGLREWQRITARRVRDVTLDYGPPEGEARLRRVVAGYLARSRGVVCQPDQIIVVTGSQQGLDLSARVLLCPGDRVLIEDPQYRGARQAFLAAGADLVAVQVDGDGLDITRAPPAAAAARLAYVTPSHQFPTGAVMSVARRLALLDWAESVDGLVIEDDYDSEFRYQGRPIEAVQGLDRYARTIYLGTFSKVLFPALRLGYMVLPEHLVEPFRAAKWLADRHTPALEQVVLADFIEDGHFEQHLRRTRLSSSRRRAALLDALGRHLPGVRAVGSNAGLHTLAWLPEEIDDFEALRRRAAAHGVGIYSVADLYLGRPPRAGLLLGYAALAEPEIEEGIRRLAAAL